MNFRVNVYDFTKKGGYQLMEIYFLKKKEINGRQNLNKYVFIVVLNQYSRRFGHCSSSFSFFSSKLHGCLENWFNSTIM